DGGWMVSGTIDVLNPNAAGDDVTGLSVVDAINDANASCNVTGGSGATVAGAGSKSFSYTCAYSAPPVSSDETNTATVTWPTQTLSDGSGLNGNSIPATADVNWGTTTPSIKDNCANVADDNSGTTVV